MKRAWRKKPRLTLELVEAAYERSGGWCEVCRFEGWDVSGWNQADEWHHILPKRRTMFPEYTLEPANLLAVCQRHHQLHEAAHQRIPREVLPDCVFRLAEPSARACAYLERTYPPAKVAA